MFGRRRTPSASPSLLMFRIDRPIARISSSLCCTESLAVVLSLWRRVRNRMDSGDSTLWYRTPSFFMAMQGVTPLLSRIAAGNGRFWNIHRTHPIWVHAITISSPKWKITAVDPVQHKKLTYPCYWVVNTEYQQRWTGWWCTTHPNTWQSDE